MSDRRRDFTTWVLVVLLSGTTLGSMLVVVRAVREPYSALVEWSLPAGFPPAARPSVQGALEAPTATIAFVGSVRSGEAGNGPAPRYDLLRPILQRYDLVVGNLDFAVDPERSSPIRDRASGIDGGEGQIRALAAAGVDVVATANHHSFEAGYAGARATLDALRREGVAGVGTGEQRSDLDPRIVEAGPLRLALVAYTSAPDLQPGGAGGAAIWRREWPINELYFDDWSGPYREEGVALFTHHASVARADGADVLVALVHWGREWHTAPTRHQRLAARDMMDAGIDLVIGTGPHVLNGAELVEDGLVAYSLGDLASPFRALELRTGALLEVGLVRDPDGGVTLGDFAFRPLLSESGGRSIRPVRADADGDARRALGLAREILGGGAVVALPAAEGG